ncbi:hypothetical protein THZG08_10252 [Vibrio owensii]|nr:hypothetical protein THZG08_10252 [Vibrio owensii]CAH1549096.1 hypothetical protein THOA03_10251 [Vibrio owensii]
MELGSLAIRVRCTKLKLSKHRFETAFLSMFNRQYVLVKKFSAGSIKEPFPLGPK